MTSFPVFSPLPSSRHSPGRVLMLNSTVVSGFAGAKSCTFPMQVLGLDVDPIYTTQHSNHSGYPHVHKADLSRQDLIGLFQGIRNNDLLQSRYDYFFTGFIADERVLQDIVEMFKEIKTGNPNAKWFCDTVIGDRNIKTGQEVFYCPKELVPEYRKHVLPLAEVITPNQLECELLAEVPIRSRQDAINAMQILHQLGVPIIILTSVVTEFGTELLVSHQKTVNINTTSSHTSSSSSSSSQRVYRAAFTELPYHFTGTGDCIMGLLLANMHRYPDNVQTAASKALSTMQAIIQRSVHAIISTPFIQDHPRNTELHIVQSLHDILDPPQTHHLEQIL